MYVNEGSKVFSAQCFAEQNKWLASIWNAALSWNGFMSGLVSTKSLNVHGCSWSSFPRVLDWLGLLYANDLLAKAESLEGLLSEQQGK